MKDPGIYIFTFPNGKQYVGKANNLNERTKNHFTGNGGCPIVERAIKKYGESNVVVQKIRYSGISETTLYAVEKWKIAQLNCQHPNGYNIAQGGEGFTSETARQMNLERVAKGTNPWAGKKGSEHSRKLQLRRLADGTHQFSNSEFQSKQARKQYERGTHPFLNKEWQSQNQRKLVAKGEHNFLGGWYSRRANYAKKMKWKNIRRERYRLFASLLYTKSVCEIHIHNQRIREGFFSKDIPDTTNAEKIALFE